MNPGTSPLLSAATYAAASTRLAAAAECLQRSKLDGLLVSNDTDILYLTGFVGHDSLLLVLPTAAVIISDTRYDQFLDPWRSAPPIEVVMGTRHRLEAALSELCPSRSIRRLGVQSSWCTMAAHARLAESLDNVELVSTSGIIAGLRMVKDEHEISRIEVAIGWQEAAIRAALDRLHLGMTELQFAATLEYEMKCRGAIKSSFDPIVGVGANSAIPHHQTGETPIEPGALLVDWGATTPDGYNSDLTRTFSVGPMPLKIAEIYSIVHEAQAAAIDACRPGRRCAEIDAVARQVITDAGYGPQFAHGLGHGLGLDVHESPYFNDLDDTVLASGMIMTVEPGIYLPGIGGVRIEDDVLITDSGSRVLSHWPKSPSSAVVEPAEASAPAL